MHIFIVNTILICIFFLITLPVHALTANHTSVNQFYNLTPTQLNNAIAKSLLYYHQSSGNTIEYFGLQCLDGEHNGWNNQPAECTNNALYNPYDDRKWDWLMWPQPMADAEAKMDQFVSLVDAAMRTNPNKYDIFGMKFCFVDGWNVDFTDYRTKMEALETKYASKKFIWVTEILNTGPHVNNPPMRQFNSDVRTYMASHPTKLFLDLAAIESKGGTCNYVSGGVTYEVVCPEYWDNNNTGGASDGHPDAEGSLAMAKGLWWLMANIGTTDPTPTLTPIPLVGDLNQDGKVDYIDIRHILTNWLPQQYTIFTFNLVVSHLL